MSGFGTSGYSLPYNPNTTLPVRQPVRAIETSNIALLNGGAPLLVDGVTLADGDRVLVRGQTNGALNGVYEVISAGIGGNGVWVRSQDMNVSADVFDGIEIRVTEGTLNADTLWVLTTPNPIILDTTPLTFTVEPAEGIGSISVLDEGVLIGSFNSINFVGVDVSAASVGGVATIYIPPPPPVTYPSHWNTADGNNGNQLVTDSMARVVAFIAAPTVEGTPFSTGGWAGTSQSATRSTAAVYTTPGLTTGFGGNASALIRVFDADGVTPLVNYQTTALAGNGTVTDPSGNVSVTISGYVSDNARFSANMAVTIDYVAILTAIGRQGGKVSCSIQMFTDTVTDGTGPYAYFSDPVFIDVGPTPPLLAGQVSLGPTAGQAFLKYLSGIAYYTNGSRFTYGVSDMDELNANVARNSGALALVSNNVGLPALDQSPLPGGAGTAYFSGWQQAYNTNNVSYERTDVVLNQANFRSLTTLATLQANVRDPWGSSPASTSAPIAVLLDTYGTTSSNLSENFDDEARRQTSTYNNGDPAGNWVSAAALSAGSAMVSNGRVQSPQSAKLTNGTPTTNWSIFNPPGNPDYTGLGVPVSYFRTMVDTSGLDRASFQIVFTGTFVTSATADLAANLMVIRIRRRASSNGGQSGPTCDPLYLSGPLYDFAQFDDGLTNGQIREASSSGNTVNGTFGGFACNNGFFIEITIANANISIDSFTVVFF